MSFFKDFKSDISQAMNELMPDGNEVLEDELPKTKKKKSLNPLSKNLNNKDIDKDLLGEDLPDLDDIAPEDMLDHIDELIDGEIYNDGKIPDMLLDDDMEVNTMDMSVDDLLNQLSEKQLHSDDDNKTGDDNASDTAGALEVSDESLDSLLDSITDGDYDGSMVAQSEPVEEAEVIENDEFDAGSLDEILADEKSEIETDNENAADDNVQDVFEDENIEADTIDEADNNNGDEAEETADIEQEVTEEDTDNGENEIQDSVPEETVNETDVQTEDAVVSDDTADSDLESVEDTNDEAADVAQTETYDNDKSEIDNDIKEDNLVEDKDVISINSVEEKKAPSKASSDKSFNVADADSETTYITKGTKIKGDIETDGSIDIIGSVEGNVTCQGKIVVGGTVNGNITAGELYCNGARIEGDIKSYGSVKVGVGSMIIGSVEGESAVIAGAVNGEIDVKGPVIVDSTAVIMGNIKSRSVQINNGAVIEGFCSQSYSDIDVKSFFA